MKYNEDSSIDAAVKYQSEITGLTHFKHGNKILAINYRPDLGANTYYILEYDYQDLILESGEMQ